jgi:uncharacterized tellurite resistance protein B-like protein
MERDERRYAGIVRRVVELLREPPPPSAAPAVRREVAAAALMVECARVDTRFTDDERCAIAKFVRELFNLEDEVATLLVAIAERRADEVWSDWLFTEAIKTGFDSDAQVELIEKLWGVAYADGVLHRLEVQLIDRIATELGLSGEAVERSRRRTAENLGLDPEGSGG